MFLQVAEWVVVRTRPQSVPMRDHKRRAVLAVTFMACGMVLLVPVRMVVFSVRSIGPGRFVQFQMIITWFYGVGIVAAHALAGQG